MTPTAEARIELSLIPPETFHSRFYFPGCEVRGRVSFSGLRINTLYTALARHVGSMELTDGADRSYSESVQSDAFTMQFMCVTAKQRAALPKQVLERITLHEVDSGTSPDDCHVIESFVLSLPSRTPNSFVCSKGSCRNFLEVKCFSSEFGFQKALFPITVQRVTSPAGPAAGGKKGGPVLEGGSVQHVSKSAQLPSPSSWLCLRRESIRFSLQCPQSCSVGDRVLFRGDFWSTADCALYVDLECKAKVWVQEQGGRDNNSRRDSQETVSRVRHRLGSVARETEGPATLEARLPLDGAHPPSGFQNQLEPRGLEQGEPRNGISCWTLAHLVVAGEGREEVLATLSLEVRPQRLHLPTASSKKRTADARRKSRRKVKEEEVQTDMESNFVNAALMDGVGLSHSLASTKKLEDDRRTAASPDGDSAFNSRFDPDLDEERASKLEQNGPIHAPVNSPSRVGAAVSEEGGGKEETEGEEEEEGKREASTRAGEEEGGSAVLAGEKGLAVMRGSDGRSRQFRSFFLGLLKMRYAGGDKTVVNYQQRERREEDEEQEEGDANSLSSDSYSDGANHRHLLKRRISRRKSWRELTRPSSGPPERAESQLELGTAGSRATTDLRSGEMSLYSDAGILDRETSPPGSSTLAASSTAASSAAGDLAEHKSMAFYQSLPGSVVDVKEEAGDSAAAASGVKKGEIEAT